MHPGGRKVYRPNCRHSHDLVFKSSSADDDQLIVIINAELCDVPVVKMQDPDPHRNLFADLSNNFLGGRGEWVGR